jgi:hypothetical protein
MVGNMALPPMLASLARSRFTDGVTSFYLRGVGFFFFFTSKWQMGHNHKKPFVEKIKDF